MRVGWVVPLALAVTPLGAQTLHYEGSLGIATGTYIFTERTSSWNVSTGLALAAGPVTLRATLPVFYQNTTLVASAGSGLVPTGGSSGAAVADTSRRRAGRVDRALVMTAELSMVAMSGDPVVVPATAVTGYRWAVGDPLMGATATAVRSARFSLTLGVHAKAPLTDTTSVGTGAWDVGASVSTSVTLGPRAFAGLDVAYWSMGDAPELPLDDTVLFGATLGVLLRGGWGVAAGLSGATPVIAGFPASVSVTASLLRAGPGGSVGALVSAGLTETAADVSVALTWRVGLLR